MGLLESVGAGVKAVAASLAPASATPFSNWGTGILGSSSASGYLASGAPDMGVAGSPGSRDDYANDVGDVSLNAVVSAGIMAIAEAFCAAPMILEQAKGESWNRVEMHPCIELLRNPNPFYGYEQLWEAEIAGEIISGNGYFRIVMNRARTQPVEIWHESLIAPVFDARHFIGSYRIFVDGRPYSLGASALYGQRDDPMRGARVDQALHFRYRLNRRNARFGESPLGPVYREIAGDNVAATWHTAVMKNGAGASFFITAKEGVTITPKQMEEVVSQIERRLRREGAGRVAGSNLEVDFHKTSFSPDELALDKLPARFESRILSNIKVPPMILGLSSGEATKTYSNMQEAIKDFWRRTIIPYQNRKLGELETQLFPLFGMEKTEWRLGFDLSQIAALQDDETALYDRVTKAVGGVAWLTRNEARGKAKFPALPEMEDKAGEEPDASNKDEATKAAPKSNPNPNWEESKHPRADGGEFGTGSSAPVIGEKITEQQVLSDLRDRADQGLPEGAYAIDPATGVLMDYAQASEEKPDEVSLDSENYRHLKEVHVYHSHPYESPPSHVDWHSLLNETNITRMISVTPKFVYSMERKKGGESKGYSPEKADLVMLAHVQFVKLKSYKGKTDKEIGEENLVKIWDEANLRMAKDYNILLTKKEHE